MEREKPAPAVEPQYEDPPPREQSIWNLGIYSVVAVIAVIFLVVILLAIFAF
jgi:hypothetical protein